VEFKKAAVVLAVSLGAYVSARVAAGGYDIALVGLWLTSILVFCGAWFDGRLIILDRGKIRIWLGIGLLALLPVIVRVSLFDMSRIHGDDVISAWISATTDFSTANFFGGFPLSKVDWMGQFPAVYFVIQRGIVEVLGRNMAAIKWSVQPYVWLVGVGLYLNGKLLGGKSVGIATVVLYAFFWPAIYLETLGLHFVSSTAVFLLFLHRLLLFSRRQTNRNAAAMGMLTGAGLLFYISSYIAVPMAGLMLLKKHNLKLAVAAVIGGWLVAGPFLTYAVRWDNYFVSRAKQVDYLNGTWSKIRDDGKVKKLSELTENYRRVWRAMYIDGIGGHGGYNFGRLGLLSGFNLGLLAVGLVTTGVIFRRDSRWGWVLLAVVMSYLAMVLSIPPPAFHRFSLAFPLLILIAASTFRYLERGKAGQGWIIMAVTVALFAGDNLQKIGPVLAGEGNNRDIEVVQETLNLYPGRDTYIAAFPGFHLEKVWYFMAPEFQKRTVSAAYHWNLQNHMNPDEKYVYILTLPRDYAQQFKAADPKGNIVQFNDQYSLFVN